MEEGRGVEGTERRVHKDYLDVHAPPAPYSAGFCLFMRQGDSYPLLQSFNDFFR